MIRIFFLLMTQWALASPVLVENLRPTWTIFDQAAYLPVGNRSMEELSTIYFTVDPVRFGGHHLHVQCPGSWHLFVEGKLIFSGSESALFNLDSLSQEFGGPLFIGVHAADGFRDGVTEIVFTGDSLPRYTAEIGLRPPTFFRDYGILAGAILVIFFLLLFRTNPQLTLDYFSFAKIFSASERNEMLLASRITSSVNLLFYLFSALLTGFLLSAIFYSAGPFFHAARPLQITSLGSAFLVWAKLSVFIFILLASKLILVLVFSTLFNFRETVSFQFFNFLRFVLFTGVTLAILSLLFFIFRVDAPIFYERLVVLGLILLIVGSVFVLVKLLGKSRFSFFHLFSYLCVSEFIPLVIIIKIFF